MEDGGSQSLDEFMAAEFNTTAEEGGGEEEGDSRNTNGQHENEHLSFDLNEDPPPPSPQPEVEQPASDQLHHEKRLSIGTKTGVMQFLLSRASYGHLPVGTIKEAASMFNISVRTVGRIWRDAKEQHNAQVPFTITTNYHKCGRKRISVNQEHIESLQMGERSCLRDLATNIGVSKSTCQRMVKRGEIRPHINPMHPGLTDLHKIMRIKWILDHLQGEALLQKSAYMPMFDYVHLDEKWFYLSKKSHRVYLAQQEKGKYRSGSSSKWIPKFMFTPAVARPRFNSKGACTFDGIIGIFPSNVTGLRLWDGGSI